MSARGSVGLTVTPVEGIVSILGSVGLTVTPVGGTVSARGSIGMTVTIVGWYSVRSGERGPDSDSCGV